MSLVGARDEIVGTGKQLPDTTIAVQSWSRALPAGASVRLDMWAPDQLWAAYMLSRQRVCSQAPLFGTDYPRVRISRRADYVLVDRRLLKPVDAVGPPLRKNVEWALYRMSPTVPGPDRCSQRMVQTVTSAY